MAAAIPLVVAAISAGTTIYSTISGQKARKKAQRRAEELSASANAGDNGEQRKVAAFRERLSSGGRGLLGFAGDDALGTTLGS